MTRYRESTRSLESVVKELMETRDAHWVPTAIAEAPTIPAQPALKKPTQMNSQFLAGPVILGKPTARRMKDGTKLRGGFQTGKCKNKAPCPQGAHRCAVPESFLAQLRRRLDGVR